MKIRRFLGFRRIEVPEEFQTIEGNYDHPSMHVAVVTKVVGSRYEWHWRLRWIGNR